MIPPETIEQVAAANDIAEVIGSYLPLKRAGSTYKALCPFHREKSPSFTVNPARQMFKCFGCGAGGGVFKFVTMFENIDFPAAVRRLAERAGITIVEENGSRDGEDRGAGERKRRLKALHAEAADWFHRNLMRNPAAQHARDYLKSRGLTSEVAARWKLGYAPDAWDACKNWAQGREHPLEELIQSGLIKARNEGEDGGGTGHGGGYDRFRDRLMFPISNELGEVIAFSGRVLTADPKAAKYVNSPETPLFTKGKVLFGLHMAKRALLEAKFAIVCEGQIDLITAFEAGIQNVTAPQGTAFTVQQALLLKRHVEEVVLCFDSDAAGQQAAERSLPALLEANVSVRVATMPPGEDPDSLIRNQGSEAFSQRIADAKDFFDFQIERMAKVFDLDTPRGKAQFSRRIAESVALLTDPLLREAVVGKVSARLGLAPQDFRTLLKKRAIVGRARTDADLRGTGAAMEAGEEGEVAEFEKPPRYIIDLVKVALESADARGWLSAQSWEELLPGVAGSELLVKALAPELRLNDAAGLTAFLASLPPEEEELVSGLMMDRPFPQPLAVAQGGWMGLEEKLLRERIAIVSGRLNTSGCSLAEIAQLQVEFVQLKLKEIEMNAKKDRVKSSSVIERNP